ncbi:MAG TPA: hypothetical protein DEB07_03430 [Candidatus Moranbacteria bacterium]|nr:hypothetical protein [Candidatus Moranbacteria bacterium]HBU25260.1 hypothetical protein [Candidatus Moranbacteria bacterium]
MHRRKKQNNSNNRISLGRIFLAAAIHCIFLQGNCQAAMTSSNYKIDADVIGGAGNTSTSANYRLGDTLGEPVIGEGASASYKTGAGFWYMVALETEPLSLDCEAEDVYMTDYTLGSADNFNTYLFSADQECVATDNTAASWSVSMQSTDMTSASNTIPDENVNLSTNGVIGTSPTITSPALNVTETADGDHPLSSPQDIVSGSASASGDYNVRPSIKLVELNSLHNESTSGTLTITIQ